VSDYIKRDEVTDEMEKLRDGFYGDYPKAIAKMFIVIASTAPAENVIPVVRCRDCIESGSNMKRSTFCYLFDKEMDMDFYCANGKEKNA